MFLKLNNKMPYSWNRPPVPIDKSKQGGRNFDSSTYTDFLKIGTISQVNATKTAGTNNKNLYTDLKDIRRTNILISGLQTIPRALCPTCPQTTINSQSIISASTLSALSGITFFVVYSSPSVTPSYLNNNILYTDSNLTTRMTNSSVIGCGRVGSVTSLPLFPEGTTRAGVVSALNTILNTYTFNTDNRVVASVTSDGRLVLSITGSTPFPTGGNPPYFAGLFFGDGPSGTGNGSTSLGATNLNGRCGVNGAALVVTEGNTSVTAPYIIGDSRINYSLPVGSCNGYSSPAPT